MANRHHKFVFTDDRARELAEWRERAGMTQRQASEALGIKGQNTVSRWENMTRHPSREDFDRAMLLYRSKFAERHNDDVPRGTSGGPSLVLRERGVADVVGTDWWAITRSEPAENYLEQVQSELRGLRVPHDERDAAMRTVRNPPESAARPPRAPWTPEEVVHVMQERAGPILEMWRIWARMR